jgi:AcrR family transcriptional regulator
MESKKQLRIEIILNVAAELAEEKGFENITLKELAEKLDIKPPSLYNHISGLSELSSGLAKLAIQRLEDVVRNAAIGKSKGEALLEIAHAYRKFAKENPELNKAILKLRLIEDRGLREAEQLVVRIIYKVMEPYHYSEEDTIHFERGFRSAIHGFVSLEEADFFRAAIDADESYNRLVTGLISTLNVQENT